MELGVEDSREEIARRMTKIRQDREYAFGFAIQQITQKIKGRAPRGHMTSVMGRYVNRDCR
jgi:hypothetical protein